MIMFLLLIMVDAVKWFIFTQEFGPAGKALQQPHQHVYDADKLLFGRNNVVGLSEFACDNDIQARGTFQCGATTNLQKPSAISPCPSKRTQRRSMLRASHHSPSGKANTGTM